VTFTVNDDGSVTCNGTAVGIYNTFSIPFKASGGTYILNGCPKSGSDNSYRLDIRDSSGSVIAFDYGEGTGGVQLGDSATYRITIRLQQNYICVNLTFYPMIRPADITATDYEPYHEPQTVSIELDAPLRKVGDEADYIDFREQKQYIVTDYVTADINNIVKISSRAFWVQTNKKYVRGLKNIQSDKFEQGEKTVGNYCFINHNGDIRFNTLNEYSTVQDMLHDIGDIHFIAVLQNQIEVPISLPAIPTIDGTNILSVATET
jgi:hypothetical protein